MMLWCLFALCWCFQRNSLDEVANRRVRIVEPPSASTAEIPPLGIGIPSDNFNTRDKSTSGISRRSSPTCFTRFVNSDPSSKANNDGDSQGSGTARNRFSRSHETTKRTSGPINSEFQPTRSENWPSSSDDPKDSGARKSLTPRLRVFGDCSGLSSGDGRSGEQNSSEKPAASKKRHDLSSSYSPRQHPRNADLTSSSSFDMSSTFGPYSSEAPEGQNSSVDEGPGSPPKRYSTKVGLLRQTPHCSPSNSPRKKLPSVYPLDPVSKILPSVLLQKEQVQRQNEDLTRKFRQSAGIRPRLSPPRETRSKAVSKGNQGMQYENLSPEDRTSRGRSPGRRSAPVSISVLSCPRFGLPDVASELEKIKLSLFDVSLIHFSAESTPANSPIRMILDMFIFGLLNADIYRPSIHYLESRASELPLPLDVCRWLLYLFIRGTNTKDIFRAPAEITLLSDVQKLICVGKAVDYTRLSPEIFADLLKWYLRNLQIPVIPAVVTEYLFADPGTSIHSALGFLPLSNRLLLASLCQIFGAIDSQSEVTKMPLQNLSQILVPTIFQLKVEDGPNEKDQGLPQARIRTAEAHQSEPKTGHRPIDQNRDNSLTLGDDPRARMDAFELLCREYKAILEPLMRDYSQIRLDDYQPKLYIRRGGDSAKASVIDRREHETSQRSDNHRRHAGRDPRPSDIGESKKATNVGAGATRFQLTLDLDKLPQRQTNQRSLLRKYDQSQRTNPLEGALSSGDAESNAPSGSKSTVKSDSTENRARQGSSHDDAFDGPPILGPEFETSYEVVRETMSFQAVIPREGEPCRTHVSERPMPIQGKSCKAGTNAVSGPMMELLQPPSPTEFSTGSRNFGRQSDEKGVGKMSYSDDKRSDPPSSAESKTESLPMADGRSSSDQPDSEQSHLGPSPRKRPISPRSSPRALRGRGRSPIGVISVPREGSPCLDVEAGTNDTF